MEKNAPWNIEVGVFSATDPDGDYLSYNSEQLGESPESLSGFHVYYNEWNTAHLELITSIVVGQNFPFNLSYWDERNVIYFQGVYL